MTAAVIASCADHYGVLVDQVLGRCRTKRTARARQAAMYVLSKRDGMPSTAVGRIFDRDHSTVLYGLDVVEKKRPTDPQLDALVTMLMALPRYHREVERVEAPVEHQLSFQTPIPAPIILRYSRPRNPHPAVCTVTRKPKNDLSPDDKDAIKRLRGTDKLLSALRQAGFA